MKNKVLILTSEESFHNNYGALLQGYALEKIIGNLGYDVSIIRYKGDGSILKNSFFKNPITRRIKKIIKKWFTPTPKCFIQYKKEIAEREKRFLEFENSNMSFYNLSQTSYQTLKKAPPKAFAYICGSDQIWNPVFRGGKNDHGYFLDFVPAGVKRIAYAPSLGVNEVPEIARDEMASLLDKMDFISVREKSGAEIIKKLTGKEVPVVLDPTLAVDRESWRRFALLPVNAPRKKYILVYHFSDKNCLREVACDIARKFDMEIITIPVTPVAFDDGFINVFAGPREFIGLIKNAELVCTDSFHATVFSILTETPFLTFLRENINRDANINSRVEDLLSMTALSDRIIHSSSKIDMTGLFDVNFSHAHKEIDMLRNLSVTYLKQALDEKNHGSKL